MTAPLMRHLTDSWRYPDLMQVGGNAGDETWVRRAILDGLADPVADRADAVTRLCARGEFEAADVLAEDDDVSREAVEQARAAAAAHLGRKIAALRGRARRMNISEAPYNGILEAGQRSLRLAESLLARWASDIDAAEQDRAAELKERLHSLGGQVSPARAESVLRCISLGFFAEASGILEGRDQEETSGPERYPHAPPWPRQWSWQSALGWLLETPDVAPARFTTAWRPADEDADAWGIIRALHTLIKDPSLNSLRSMADALDRLIGNPDDSHRIEETSGGFRTSLAALRDSRLPNLALPWRMPLWFSPSGAPPPDGFERPVIWLCPDNRGIAQPGVAVLDTPAILTLVQPDDGALAGPALRRIRTLRAVCQQLRLGDLVGSGMQLDLGDAHAFRHDLAWLLDLLGVRVSPEALDIISYDTGEHPVAIRAMLGALLPDQGRPAEITGESLRAWTLSDVAVPGFRDDVLRALLDDAETAAVLTTVLWAYGASPEASFDRENVESALIMLAELLEAPGAAVFSYLTRGLGKAVRTGLVQLVGDQCYRLGPEGLIGLLAADQTALEDYARHAFRELNSGRELVRQSLRSRLSLMAIRHLFDNHLEAFAQLAYSLNEQKDRLPPDIQQSAYLAVSSYERMEDYRRAAEADALAELEQPRTFDLGVLLRETCEENQDRRVRLSLEFAQTPLLVRASRFMAKMVVENMLINARRAIFDSGNTRGTVRVRVGFTDDAADGPRATIDIEDSGPGVPPERRRLVANLVSGTGSEDDAESGLAQARELLEYCGGTLTFIVDGSADLGGAHFQVILPVERS